MFLSKSTAALVTISLIQGSGSHTTISSGFQSSSRVQLAPNIVLIVLDDVGLDKLALYGAVPATGGSWNGLSSGHHPIVETAAALPNLGLISSRGVRFQHAYATPLCSPSRAELLSGLYGHQTGMLHLSETPVIAATGGGCTLAPVNLLPEVLKSRGYRCGAFGKWHLTVASDTCHPIQCGFDVFTGHIGNNESPSDGNAGTNHFHWPLVAATSPCTNPPVAHASTLYDADVTRTEARTFIDDHGSSPFFAYVSFHAPHLPFQLPPIHMVSPGTLAEIKALNGWTEDSQYIPGDIAIAYPACDTNTPEHFKARLYYKAALESIDWEIGQLLHSNLATLQITDLENTLVLIVGDNGTPNEIVQSISSGASAQGAPYPANHAKRFIYELGIRVPLIAYGPANLVDRHGLTTDAMVSLVDVWKTLADLAGATPVIPPGSDSQSFAYAMANPGGTAPPGCRTEVYTEIANWNGLFYSGGSQNPTWSPAAPSTYVAPNYNFSVTYNRAVVTSTGMKYIRRCTPDGDQTSASVPCMSGAPLSGGACLPTAPCGVPMWCGYVCSGEEEFYQVFGALNPDPNEVESACSWFTGGEKDVLRCLISDKTGN